MGVKWPHRLRSTELLGLGCLWRGDGPGSSHLLGIHTATESFGAGDSRSPFNSAQFKVSHGQFRPWRPRPNFLNLPSHQPSSLPPPARDPSPNPTPHHPAFLPHPSPATSGPNAEPLSRTSSHWRKPGRAGKAAKSHRHRHRQTLCNHQGVQGSRPAAPGGASSST